MRTADKQRAARAAYRARNKEKVEKQITEWRRKNPHKAKEYAAKRYALHSEKILAADRARRAANPEIGRRSTRKWKYKQLGVDPVAAEATRAAHKGRCDCCATDVPGSRGWAMDHDHRTGRVRGILCFNCNIAIGKLGDTLEGVLRAVRYLQRNQE